MSLRGFNGGIIVGLIALVVFVLVALSLTPSIANSAQAVATTANVSPAGQSIAPLITLMYIVLIVISVVSFMALR